MTDTADEVARARRQALGDVLRRTALRHPSKLAVVAGDRRLRYAEFDAAVNRCANRLAAEGLAKGDRLALLSRNCLQFPVLAFAAARLGAVLVPVNFMLGVEEIAYILRHSGASGLVAQDALLPTAEKALAAAGATGGDILRGRIPGDPGSAAAAAAATSAAAAGGSWQDVDEWIASGDDSDPDVLVADDDPLRLMYTSGTESRPKGVLLSSRSLIAQYVSCVVDGGMTSDDVEVHALPMYHCAQLDCFFSVDVYLGATSVILPGPDPAALLAAIERERASKLFCPPTVWISLLRHPDFDRTDLSSLRKGYYGASPMPAQVLAELSRRLPDVRLWNFYGQTEMAPLATILPPHEQSERPGSAGRAALNVETRVVGEDDRPLPPGQVGEIVHRSPHAALGYYNDPEKTAEAFRGGWFHSGDLGVLDEDGYLAVVDRKKDMIKTGGENVASREVEEALYRIEGVGEAAVFGVPHPHWIEAVTAIIVRKPDEHGAALTEARIQAGLRGHLAGYKRPKYVRFAGSLPKNPSGKILKRDLRDAYRELAEGDGD
ncbi:acyl-CoA synthetase [Phaeacidiphilus oryzae]|uniref:acyl-CoA synthetase n=1 Tax=Phaeacidiphilus oryzae TaxID=348818 RepID=UPI00056B2DFF|nr:acyl-CoA synthetase [Phaeacidiphilus oryzae]